MAKINPDIASNSKLDLNLVYQERLGDFIFLLGTLLAIISTYQAERAIIVKLLKIRSASDSSAYTIAAASWLFFIASIFFAHVAIVRLIEIEMTTNSQASPSMLKAGRLVAIGNILKFIGFGLAAIGNQLKANLSQSSNITVISQ